MYRMGGKKLECSPAERNMRVLVDGKLSICALAAERASRNLERIKYSIDNQWKKVTVP